MKNIKVDYLVIFCSLSLIMMLVSSPVMSEVKNFGSRTPTVDEFVSGLKPKLRFRGIRPTSKVVEPPTVSMNIEFEFNSYELGASPRAALNNLSVALMRPEFKDTVFLIEGHTDAVGSNRYNQWLSQMRADAVKKYLVERGVDPERLRSVGRGEDNLLDTENPASHVNRRVAVVNAGTSASSVELIAGR